MHYLRTHYLLAFGTVGAIVPFQPLLLHDIGMPDWHIGLILSTPGFAALIAPVLVSYIADRHLSSRKILLFGYALSAVALALLFVLRSFSSIVALTLLINFIYAPALALLDVVSLHAVRQGMVGDLSERDFPLIRRWGSVGFAMPALVLFLLTSVAGLSPHSVYLVGCFFALGSAALAYFLPDLEPAGRTAHEIPTVTALKELSRPPLGALTLALFICCIGLSMFYLLMPRYLQELGLSMSEVGLIVTLGVLWEIALFSIAPRLLERIGIRWATISGFGVTAVRFILLGAIPSVGIAAATQILHAPLVLVLAVVVPVIFTRAAAPAIRNSLLGLASSLYNGLSRIVGPPIAGAIIAAAPSTSFEGLQNAFIVAGVFCVIGTLVLLLRFHEHDSPPLDALDGRN